MLKMNMITFFKKPIIRDIFIVLTAMIIVAGVISIPKSNAGAQVNVAFRAAPMGVSIGTKDFQIPELAPGQNDLKTKAKKYNNVFCIDEGTQLSYETYQTEYNLYNASESSKYFKNYNSALWLIDNMYISTSSDKKVNLDYLANLVTSPDVAKNVTNYGTITSENIKSLNKTVGNGTDTSGNKINRNLIEIIEQLVLWNYTNNKNATFNTDVLVNAGFSGSNITSADQNACKYLYYSLKYLANKNANYKSNGTTNNVISLDSSKAVIDVNKGQVGPYYLKANGVALNIADTIKSKMSATITKLDGTTQALSNEQIIVNSDGSFYINIKDCGNVTKSELKIEAIYSGVKTTCEVLVNNKTQNIINIRKTINTKELSDSKSVSYSGKYTVKLIKTKADGSTLVTNNPAEFSVTGSVEKNAAKTGDDGILVIAQDKNIESAAAVETYKIVEAVAPNGYEKYDGEINLTVKFKLNGTEFVVDKENTSINGTGKNGTVKLNVVNNNTIEIYLPNTETQKPEPEKPEPEKPEPEKPEPEKPEPEKPEPEKPEPEKPEPEKPEPEKPEPEKPEPEKPEPQIFDLSLRKYITTIDGKVVEISREPVIDAQSKFILEKYHTAAYHHTKQSLLVREGSIVEYTIRIYNESEIAGYAKEIRDYLPEGLTFIKLAEENSKLYTAETTNNAKTIIIKYNGNETILPDSITRIINKQTNQIYQEVKVICKVEAGAKGYITSRAEITNYGYYDKENVWHEAKAIGNSDRDSVQNTISNSLNLKTWYEDAKTYTYVDSTGKTVPVKDYYPGVQDDDDFETVEVMSGAYKVVIRKVDSSNKNQGLAGAYFSVKTGIIASVDKNQGTGVSSRANTDLSITVGPTNSNGYVDVATKQKITAPNDTRLFVIKETTAPEGYEGYNKDIKLHVATTVSNTGYVLDEQNTKLIDNTDGKVNVNVNASTSTITITIPNEKKDFDFTLRKFITSVNDKQVTTREPEVILSEDFKSGKVTTATYNHPKDTVDECTGDIVTYKLRVYNEAGLSGYALKVMDEIPDGLEFLPENSINTKYGWKMYKETNTASSDSIKFDKKIYVPTQNASEADVVITEYLKDTLIKGYNESTMSTLDFKDVEIAFKVIESNKSDRILINAAQIIEHADFNKQEVTDRDSIPNEWNEGEDDQDIEKIKLKYFDLALRKWVTEAIVTENGQTQVIQTGHKAEDNPEDIVKVDLKKSKLKDITVKFRYSIRITNQGEIAGYAKEVSDYIPEGLKFVQEDNPSWKQVDGKVVTEALANTLLQPGESAEVSILLTWVNRANNMGLKINVAEISKDYNEFGTPDIDSTPNNKKDGEDDIDNAPVMLTVKTGSDAIFYITLGLGFFIIIGLGAFEIKKKII